MLARIQWLKQSLCRPDLKRKFKNEVRFNQKGNQDNGRSSSQLINLKKNIEEYINCSNQKEKNTLLSYNFALYNQMKQKLLKEKKVPLQYMKLVAHFIPIEVMRLMSPGNASLDEQFDPFILDFQAQAIELGRIASEIDPCQTDIEAVAENIYRLIGYVGKFECVILRRDYQASCYLMLESLEKLSRVPGIENNAEVVEKLFRPIIVNSGLAVIVIEKPSAAIKIKAKEKHPELKAIFHDCLSEIIRNNSSLITAKELLILINFWNSIANKDTKQQSIDSLGIEDNTLISMIVMEIERIGDNVLKSDKLTELDIHQAVAIIGSSTVLTHKFAKNKIDIYEYLANSSELSDFITERANARLVVGLLEALLLYTKSSSQLQAQYSKSVGDFSKQSLSWLLSEHTSDISNISFFNNIASLMDQMGLMNENLWDQYQRWLLIVIRMPTIETQKAFSTKLYQILLTLLATKCRLNQDLFNNACQIMIGHLPYSRPLLLAFCNAANSNTQANDNKIIKEEINRIFSKVKYEVLCDKSIFFDGVKIYVAWTKWTNTRDLEIEKKIVVALWKIEKIWFCAHALLLEHIGADSAVNDEHEKMIRNALVNELKFLNQNTPTSIDSSFIMIKNLTDVNALVTKHKRTKLDKTERNFKEYIEAVELLAINLCNTKIALAGSILRNNTASRAFIDFLESTIKLLVNFNRTPSIEIVQRMIDILHSDLVPEGSSGQLKLLRHLYSALDSITLSAEHQSKLYTIETSKTPISHQSAPHLLRMAIDAPGDSHLKARLSHWLRAIDTAAVDHEAGRVVDVAFYGIANYYGDEAVVVAVVEYMCRCADVIDADLIVGMGRDVRGGSLGVLRRVESLRAALMLPEIRKLGEITTQMQQVLDKCIEKMHERMGEYAKKQKETYSSKLQDSVRLVLDKLDRKYEQEAIVAGFSVDFMLDDRTILEVYGDSHFNKAGKFNQMTIFRTKLLEANGYKVVYVLQEEMAGSISQKMEILKKRLEEGNAIEYSRKVPGAMKPLNSSVLNNQSSNNVKNTL